MRTLTFDYWMEIAYSAPVQQCHYTLKCLPQDTPMQRILDLNLTLTPQHSYRENRDAFGNRMVYGDLYQAHEKFGFHVTGTAQTGLSAGAGVAPGEYPGLFRYSHGLNRAGAGIRAYYQALGVPAQDPFQKAQHLMDCLHRDFAYCPGITNVDVTAEDAWSLGRGVCQDYAHILIALCHLAKIPARYVTGMMVGEGCSHAWVEVLRGDSWFGLDPTNGCTVGESYIKIAAGRDAGDCTVNRGIVTGSAGQTQSVRILVEETERTE